MRQKLRHSVLDWHASLAVDRDFGIDDSSITYSYAGAPQGVFTLDGRPMLAAQAERQFEFWTGQQPPAGVMETALRTRICN